MKSDKYHIIIVIMSLRELWQVEMYIRRNVQTFQRLFDWFKIQEGSGRHPVFRILQTPIKQ